MTLLRTCTLPPSRTRTLPPGYDPSQTPPSGTHPFPDLVPWTTPSCPSTPTPVACLRRPPLLRPLPLNQTLPPSLPQEGVHSPTPTPYGLYFLLSDPSSFPYTVPVSLPPRTTRVEEDVRTVGRGHSCPWVERDKGWGSSGMKTLAIRGRYYSWGLRLVPRLPSPSDVSRSSGHPLGTPSKSPRDSVETRGGRREWTDTKP